MGRVFFQAIVKKYSLNFKDKMNSELNNKIAALFFGIILSFILIIGLEFFSFVALK